MPMPSDPCQINFILDRLLKFLINNSTILLCNVINESEAHLVHIHMG